MAADDNLNSVTFQVLTAVARLAVCLMGKGKVHPRTGHEGPQKE